MLTFVGLDGEMSSGNRKTTPPGRLIQIGIAVKVEGEPQMKTFQSDIGWEQGNYSTEPKALEVNGFDRARIEAGPHPYFVDLETCNWVERLGLERRKIIPIGFNVARFDLPFLDQDMPQFSEWLSGRSIDLNAICFTLADLDITDRFGSSVPGMSGWKRIMKRAAEERLEQAGVGAAWHDAEYDAMAALESWLWVREFLAEEKRRRGGSQR